MEEPMKLKLKIRNIISITVLQIQILHMSEYFLINNPNLKKFRLFILQNTKKKAIKMYVLVISYQKR